MIRQDIYDKVKLNFDHIAKPLDGLGVFEELISKIGAIQDTERPDITGKAVVVMCADNGIVSMGVSQSGQDVTLAVLKSMAKGNSSVCHMASVAGAKVFPVDIGVNTDETVPNIINCKVRKGTRNFAAQPAMTEAEALKAIEYGKKIVKDLKAKGINLIATGEMGIGNTTTSAAVVSSLLKLSPEKVTGRGAGLDDESLKRKIELIDSAIDKYSLYEKDAMEILCTVGGLDIAGLVGVFLGGMEEDVPIVIDGVISGAAALIAEKLSPGAKDFMLSSHRGKEAACDYILRELGLKPVIDGDLALGEGTGAVMLFPLLDQAMAVYNSEVSFSDIEVEQYKRV